MPEQERKSIFQTEYIKQPDASVYEGENKEAAYLKLSNKDEQFWELIITKLTETHAEKYTLTQTLSNSVTIFSGGSEPVHIEINGYLSSGSDMDYRVRFLRKYISEFRHGRLRAQDRMLEVHIRHTHFNIEIESIELIESADSPDFTSIGITGVAHSYNTDDGEPMVYTYVKAEEKPAAKEDTKGKTTLSTPNDPK